MLEGLLGLDLLSRRHAARLPARDLRAPGLRLRRQGARRAPGAPGVERPETYADRLEREAADLKRRFNRDFWVGEDEYFALALDADGGQVDALSSNIGHLLWSGIVDKSKARAVAHHLLGPRLFSGWGVRTLAEGEGRYNPIGYHVGTVWPFDNSFIAWGSAARTASRRRPPSSAGGILDAAELFDGRLPEAFGGLRAAAHPLPGGVPDRRAARRRGRPGRPLLLLRTMLGLEPVGEHLIVDPALPASIGTLALSTSPAAGAGWTPTRAAARNDRRGEPTSAWLLACADAGDPGEHPADLLHHGDLDPRADHRHRRVDADQRAAAAERKGCAESSPTTSPNASCPSSTSSTSRPSCPRNCRRSRRCSTAAAQVVPKAIEKALEVSAVQELWVRNRRDARTGDEDSERRHYRALDPGRGGEHQPRSAARPDRHAPRRGAKSAPNCPPTSASSCCCAPRTALAQDGVKAMKGLSFHPAAAGGAGVPRRARARRRLSPTGAAGDRRGDHCRRAAGKTVLRR